MGAGLRVVLVVATTIFLGFFFGANGFLVVRVVANSDLAFLFAAARLFFAANALLSSSSVCLFVLGIVEPVN